MRRAYVFLLFLVGCSTFSGLYREQALNRTLFPSVCGHSYAVSREAMLAAVKAQVREDAAWHRKQDPLVWGVGAFADLEPVVKTLEEGTRVTGFREYYWIVPDTSRPGNTYVRIQEKTDHADRIPFKEWQLMRRLDPALADQIKSQALAGDPDLNFDPYPST